MEIKTHVFQTDSEEVNKVYHTEPNFLIEHSESSNGFPNGDLPGCAVYFSSNDIYFPNTPESFDNQVVKKNRFEWYGTRVKNCQKHIFLRDIKKQWYLTGVNDRVNTIEKLEQFLREETTGYRIVTVGSSAGGFAAVLFGQLLNAHCTFTFNGQFTLSERLKNISEAINPIVFREQGNVNVNKYFSLRKFMKHPETIFYFYSVRSPIDIFQYGQISDMAVNAISFSTSHHGIPFLKSSLKHVLNSTIPELKRLSKKMQYPLLFSLRLEGLAGITTSIVGETQRYLIRRMNI